MTCCFWAENSKRKMKAKAKAMKSVASPFGLCSSLRQSGRAFGLAFYGAAEAAPLQNNYFSVSSDQVGKLREGRVAMICWVSRETVMTWPMRRRM